MWPIDRPPRWVDRSQELATLRAGVEALRRGGGTAVWGAGEPGTAESSPGAGALAGAGEVGSETRGGGGGEPTARGAPRGMPGRPRGPASGVGRLPETDLAALVTAMLCPPPEDTLRQLTAQAAGNPLYLRELVDALARERAQPGPAAGAGPARDQLPASLAAVLNDRL